MGNNAAARAFAFVSMLGLFVAVVATVVGHLGLGPGYDPLELTISDYALSGRGSAIQVAMIALAVGSLALLPALGAAGVRVRGLPTILISTWSMGLLIAAIIPTDPVGVSGMSMAAYAHRYASVTAFVALPIAAAGLASRFSRMGTAWNRTVNAVRTLCVACALGLALFWYVAFPGGRAMMGLVERGLIGLEIVLLTVLSIAVLRGTRCDPSKLPSSRAEVAAVGTTPSPAGHRRWYAATVIRTVVPVGSPRADIRLSRHARPMMGQRSGRPAPPRR